MNQAFIILQFTSENGCFAMAMAIVTENTFEPDVTAEGGILPCDAESIQLNGESTAIGATFYWDRAFWLRK